MLQAYLQACPGFAAIFADDMRKRNFYHLSFSNLKDFNLNDCSVLFIYLFARHFFHKMLWQILTAATVKFKVYEKSPEFHPPFANLSVTTQSFSAWALDNWRSYYILGNEDQVKNYKAHNCVHSLMPQGSEQPKASPCYSSTDVNCSDRCQWLAEEHQTQHRSRTASVPCLVPAKATTSAAGRYFAGSFNVIYARCKTSAES